MSDERCPACGHRAPASEGIGCIALVAGSHACGCIHIWHTSTEAETPEAPPVVIDDGPYGMWGGGHRDWWFGFFMLVLGAVLGIIGTALVMWYVIIKLTGER